MAGKGTTGAQDSLDRAGPKLAALGQCPLPRREGLLLGLSGSTVTGGDMLALLIAQQ